MESALPICRFCRNPIRRTVVDLGMSPLCESYVEADRLDDMEPFYPLHVRICSSCLLVMTSRRERGQGSAKSR